MSIGDLLPALLIWLTVSFGVTAIIAMVNLHRDRREREAEEELAAHIRAEVEAQLQKTNM